MLPEFIRAKPRLAFFAFTAVAASGFGQTFFTSVFGSALALVFAGIVALGALLASLARRPSGR